jgi:hypothetical protein
MVPSSTPTPWRAVMCSALAPDCMLQVTVRGQQSDLSEATTSYALPSIVGVFPNGTTPAVGQRKTLVSSIAQRRVFSGCMVFIVVCTWCVMMELGAYGWWDVHHPVRSKSRPQSPSDDAVRHLPWRVAGRARDAQVRLGAGQLQRRRCTCSGCFSGCGYVSEQHRWRSVRIQVPTCQSAVSPL